MHTQSQHTHKHTRTQAYLAVPSPKHIPRGLKCHCQTHSSRLPLGTLHVDRKTAPNRLVLAQPLIFDPDTCSVLCATIDTLYTRNRYVCIELLSIYGTTYLFILMYIPYVDSLKAVNNKQSNFLSIPYIHTYVCMYVPSWEERISTQYKDLLPQILTYYQKRFLRTYSISMR